MRLKAVQALNIPKDAHAITQVRAFIFDVRHTNIYIYIYIHTYISKSQLNTPESQLHSLTELRILLS